MAAPTEHERHIALEGAVNFRDLGGYETQGGRRTRWRSLFRADGLSQLTTADRAVIRQLGIATVVDLRTGLEVERGRFPVEEVPVGYHHLPLMEAVPEPQAFRLAPGLLASSYQEMIHRAAPQIGEILALVASRHAHPVIIHCTAGKDRTGVMVAVLLGVLGVPDQTIVADYVLSAEAMVRLRRKLIERYPNGREVIEKADEVFSAAPANIAAMIDALRREYGTFEDYAASAGAGPEVVAGLRDVMLS